MLTSLGIEQESFLRNRCSIYSLRINNDQLRLVRFALVFLASLDTHFYMEDLTTRHLEVSGTPLLLNWINLSQLQLKLAT